ncbi:MAG: hypothetical protein HC855_04580, partial [Rhizobiales bacterium]|nr:hypothetical protein [Hyphomicrobiales bacterium]
MSWGKNRPKRIVCAEPSPDVAEALSKAISASFSGAAQGRGNVNAEVSASMSTAVVQLGERLATVQLLRDGLYRACEAYSNGAISDATYSLIVSRVDQTMVALLGMEMAAGAFGRDLAAAGGSAGAGAVAENAEAVKALNDRKLALIKELSEARAEESRAIAKTAGLDRSVPGNETAFDDAEQATKARAALEDEAQNIDIELNKAKSGLALSQTIARSGGGIAGGVSKANAEYVAQIQQTFTDQDKLGPLLASCVTALDSSSVYKAHVHRGQDVNIDRDENGDLVTTGP